MCFFLTDVLPLLVDLWACFGLYGFQAGYFGIVDEGADMPQTQREICAAENQRIFANDGNGDASRTKSSNERVRFSNVLPRQLQPDDTRADTSAQSFEASSKRKIRVGPSVKVHECLVCYCVWGNINVRRSSIRNAYCSYLDLRLLRVCRFLFIAQQHRYSMFWIDPGMEGDVVVCMVLLKIRLDSVAFLEFWMLRTLNHDSWYIDYLSEFIEHLQNMSLITTTRVSPEDAQMCYNSFLARKSQLLGSTDRVLSGMKNLGIECSNILKCQLNHLKMLFCTKL